MCKFQNAALTQRSLPSWFFTWSNTGVDPKSSQHLSQNPQVKRPNTWVCRLEIVWLIAYNEVTNVTTHEDPSRAPWTVDACRRRLALHQVIFSRLTLIALRVSSTRLRLLVVDNVLLLYLLFVDRGDLSAVISSEIENDVFTPILWLFFFLFRLAKFSTRDM